MLRSMKTGDGSTAVKERGRLENMGKVNMDPDAKLSFIERFAYGIGDYAGNLAYSAISAFLLC